MAACEDNILMVQVWGTHFKGEKIKDFTRKKPHINTYTHERFLLLFFFVCFKGQKIHICIILFIFSGRNHKKI